MFSVYVAAANPLRGELERFLKDHPETALPLGSSEDLREALSDCARDVPGVLVLEDRLLAAEPDLLEATAEASYPVVLIANPGDSMATRRALAIRAKDFIPLERWAVELLPTLDRVALPLYRRDKKQGRVITVFSSKGGVGKTTLSVNLGVSLAQKIHEPVVIVDLDLAFGDVSSMMGLSPDLTIHDVDVQSLSQGLDQALIECEPNVTVLPAPLTPDQAEDIDSRMLLKILQALKEDYAYVILDLAPGYAEVNVSALDLSDLILTVCTPDVVTLRTVGQALSLFRDEFRYPQDKVRVVLNRTGSRTGIERADIAAILKSPNLYELPSAGPMPVRAANDGVPFVTREPRAPLSIAVAAIADDILREEGTRGNRNARRPSKRGLLTRSRRGN